MSASSTRYTHDKDIGERERWQYDADLVDEAGALITAARFSVLTVKIHALDAARTVIQTTTNILNAGRGTISAAGHQRIVFTAADSAMVDPTRRRETRLATVEGIYDGTGEYAREILWVVKNMEFRT